MKRVYVATTNHGKLRDFSAIALPHGIEIYPIPDLQDLSPVAEDADTFEGNARKKAEHYSRFIPGQHVLCDDSGLEVDALGGAPGIHSARYASGPHYNSTDAENNARLVYELRNVPEEERTARFICVLALARDGETLVTFSGEAAGRILFEKRGPHGFGYDPLFFFPELGVSFAELTPEQKASVSHRGKAFRSFVQWASAHQF